MQQNNINLKKQTMNFLKKLFKKEKREIFQSERDRIFAIINPLIKNEIDNKIDYSCKSGNYWNNPINDIINKETSAAWEKSNHYTPTEARGELWRIYECNKHLYSVGEPIGTEK